MRNFAAEAKGMMASNLRRPGSGKLAHYALIRSHPPIAARRSYWEKSSSRASTPDFHYPKSVARSYVRHVDERVGVQRIVHATGEGFIRKRRPAVDIAAVLTG
jgi:hypothetical protein